MNAEKFTKKSLEVVENCEKLESFSFTGTKLRWASVSKLWHWREKMPAIIFIFVFIGSLLDDLLKMK